MGNQYLVVSDLHLCDAEEHADGWRHFKSARFHADADFDALVTRFVAQAEGAARQTLILDGDVFDFDLVTAVPAEPPWPVRRSERKRGLDPTAGKSVFKLERMLADHPQFIATLARFLLGGGRLVYVLGNHDREFHFPAVQRCLVAALERAAAAASDDFTGIFPDGAIRFEPWFYIVPGEIYVEHGHQYDHYTAFRHVLQPTVETTRGEQIALPMGNLSNRYLMSQMGFFNPHASEYILNLFAYAAHWLKFYAFTRRSILLSWFWGSLVVMGKLLRLRKLMPRKLPDLTARLADYAVRFDLPAERVVKLFRLQEKPITSRFYWILREFWIDRLLMAVLMTGGTIALALVPIPLWIKLMVPLSTFPLVYFVYEAMVSGESIFNIEQELPETARRIAELFPVRVVTFGHTHVPRLLPLARETTFVDTGTWAPVTFRTERARLKPGYRNYLLVSFDERQEACVTFDSWMPREAAETS